MTTALAPARGAEVVRAAPVDVAGCRAVLAHHAKSFRWAGGFLPRRQLDDAAIVYALCRLVDDIADERTSDEEALEQLDAVEQELRGETPPRPLVELFLQVAGRADVPVAAMLELIEGVRTDMYPVAMRDDRELLRYCYRVAGTVGLLMCGVIGVTARRAQPFAVDLGVGMQLTNICRDVAEDAERERVYLPATRLGEAGTTQGALLSASRQSAAPVVRDLLGLAERYYRSGDAGMRFIPWRARFAILVASRVYRAIGAQVAAQGFDPDRGRASVSTAGKLWHTLGAAAAFVRLLFVREKPHAAQLHAALDGLPGTHEQVGSTPLPAGARALTAEAA